MAKTNKSPDVNLTAFDILQAMTGELPCYASPDPSRKEPAKSDSRNGKPAKKKDLPENGNALGQEGTGKV